MPTIEDAIDLAAYWHRGQTDKAGLPYILHPLRVMGAFVRPGEDDLRIIAVLHDIVEDTEVTLGVLDVKGYSQTVIDAIDAISRRPGEPYDVYIERCAQNPLAARVKMADLHDNLDSTRASTEMIGAATRRRYESALAALLKGNHPFLRTQVHC
jgi:GTP diphosphokinase / guanosine-3',5'-bis(diphosphate) 3'-diphosphatase